MINCNSITIGGGDGDDGGPVGTKLPVAAFAKLFVTLPMNTSAVDDDDNENNTNNRIYGELIGLVNPKDPVVSQQFFRKVQLNR